MISRNIRTICKQWCSKNIFFRLRVLEAASSSPATSTKKNTDSPYGCLCSSLLCRSGKGSSSPFAHRAKSSSHSKRSREELAHLRRAIGIFSSAENPAIKLKPYANSPTARKYSLLFNDSYTPNDAIYRKRYASATTVSYFNSLFPSGASSQTVINCFLLAYPPLRPKQKVSNPLILLGFWHFFSFLLFAAKSVKTRFDHITDHNGYWQICII